METDDRCCQPTAKRRRTDSRPEPLDTMSSVLENEYFLLMIFEHLVEYGLHDCRLVCRRWYEVCQQFPLQLNAVTGDPLGMIAAFPNVTSLSIHRTQETVSAVEFFAPLASLSNLKSLSIKSSEAFYDWKDSDFFEPLSQLTDLKIEYAFSGPPDSMIASIRRLTNLTRLAVYGGGPWIGAPVTFLELRKIRELQVCNDLFVDEHGACLFPSLTNLTRLELSSGVIRMKPLVVPFGAISVYASTLEYLSLSQARYGQPVDFAALTSLEKLGILKVDGWFAYDGRLEAILPQLPSVKRLEICDWTWLSRATQEAIAACTGLKALCCPQTYLRNSNQMRVLLVSRVTQLTELAATVYGKLIPELSRLTLLTRLSLEIRSNEDYSLDEPLWCMPDLQILEVWCRNTMPRSKPNLDEVARLLRELQRRNGPDAVGLGLSGEVFAHMDRLRSVSVERVDVSKSFFRELSSKTGLTKLEFVGCDEIQYTRSFISQINLLKNLEELTLSLPEQRIVCNCLSPTDLTRLKRLNIDGTERQINQLRRNFNHSIFPVLVNQKKSPWCSRLAA